MGVAGVPGNNGKLLACGALFTDGIGMGGGIGVAGVTGAGVTGMGAPGMISHGCGDPRLLPQVGQDEAGMPFQGETEV